MRSVIPIFLGIIIFSSEALVSGQASFTLLETTFSYSYTENSAKKIHHSQYEKYWAEKKKTFSSVLIHGFPEIDKLAAEIKSAQLPIMNISLVEKRILKNPKLHVVSFLSNAGKTNLEFSINQPLTPEQSKTLELLCKKVDYSLLNKKWIQAGSPSYDNTAIKHGIFASEWHSKFSLAVSLMEMIRKENVPFFQTQIETYLKKISPKITAEFENFVKKGTTWTDPKLLISLKEKIGETAYLAKMAETDTQKSIFNPRGPLHDSFGRRSSATHGLLIVTMLFLTQGNNWPEDPTFLGNTGTFENWLQQFEPK